MTMRGVAAAMMLSLALVVAGCMEGSPEKEAAWHRGQQECWEISDSARDYEECKEILEAWLEKPEENSPPSFVR